MPATPAAAAQVSQFDKIKVTKVKLPRRELFYCRLQIIKKPVLVKDRLHYFKIKFA
jgi:hypothetical protein